MRKCLLFSNCLPIYLLLFISNPFSVLSDIDLIPLELLSFSLLTFNPSDIAILVAVYSDDPFLFITTKLFRSNFFLALLRLYQMIPISFNLFILLLNLHSMFRPSLALNFALNLCEILNTIPPIWICFLKILLSNDVELNPGDLKNAFFSFCNWNVNSLGKGNFSRVQLIEAHNSLYSYDLISLCETSLNDSVEIPDNLLEGYSFIPKNKPSNSRHGGVCLFFKKLSPFDSQR